jgi:hypothetical protein
MTMITSIVLKPICNIEGQSLTHITEVVVGMIHQESDLLSTCLP